MPRLNDQLWLSDTRDSSYQNATTRRAEELKLRGNWLDRKAEITLGGVPVRRISRQFMNAGQLLFDKQTYILTVAPGGMSTCGSSLFGTALMQLRMQWMQHYWRPFVSAWTKRRTSSETAGLACRLGARSDSGSPACHAEGPRLPRCDAIPRHSWQWGCL